MMILRCSSLILFTVVLAACGALADGFTLEDGASLDGGISVVNGRIDVGRNCQVAGAVKSVNGGIQIGSGSQVERIENVNGVIEVAANSTVDGSIGNVNGGIRLAENVQVGGPIETVNGRIETAAGTVIDGQIQSVNGRINLTGTRAAGLVTYNSSVTVGPDSHLSGPLQIKRSRGMNFDGSAAPRIVIAAGSRIDGELSFERTVELHVHETAVIGEVSGAEIIRYSGDQP